MPGPDLSVSAAITGEAQVASAIEQMRKGVESLGASAKAATMPWKKETEQLNAALQDNILRLKAQKELLQDPVYQQSIKHAASLRDEVNKLSKAAQAHDEVEKGVFSNMRTRREALVMAHEAMQGRFKNLAGSAMVFAEYADLSIMHTIMTAINPATIAMAGGTVAVVGVTAALYHMGEAATENWHKMSLLAETVGTTAENVQAFEHAAIGTGASSKQVGTALEMFTIKLTDHRIELEKIGITARDPIKAFEQLMDIAKRTTDPIERNKIMSEALGRSWKELAPFLIQGGQAIEDARKAMKPDPEAVARMEEMIRLQKQTSKEWDVIKQHAGQSATVVTSVITKMGAAWLHASTMMKIASLTGNSFVIGKMYADENARLAAQEAKEKADAVKDEGKTKQRLEWENHTKMTVDEENMHRQRLAMLKSHNLSTQEEEKRHLARVKEIREAFEGPDKKAKKPKAVRDRSSTVVLSAADSNHELIQAAKEYKRLEDAVDRVDKAIHKEELDHAQSIVKMVKAEQNLVAVKQKAAHDATEARQKEVKSWIDGFSNVTSSVNQGLINMGKKHHTFRGEINDIWDSITENAVMEGLKISEAWAARQVVERLSAKETAAENVATMQAEAAAKQVIAAEANLAAVAQGAATGMTLAQFYATPAALAATASFGGAAITGGAALSATVAEAHTLASFDVGTRSVRGDQLAQIHDQETIFPRPVSQAMRAGDWGPAMRFMGQGGSSSTSNTSSQTNHITVNVSGSNASPQAIAQAITRALPIQRRKFAGSSF